MNKNHFEDFDIISSSFKLNVNAEISFTLNKDGFTNFNKMNVKSINSAICKICGQEIKEELWLECVDEKDCNNYIKLLKFHLDEHHSELIKENGF